MSNDKVHYDFSDDFKKSHSIGDSVAHFMVVLSDSTTVGRRMTACRARVSKRIDAAGLRGNRCPQCSPVASA